MHQQNITHHGVSETRKTIHEAKNILSGCKRVFLQFERDRVTAGGVLRWTLQDLLEVEASTISSFIKSKPSDRSRSHATLHDPAGVLPLRGHKRSENRKRRAETRNGTNGRKKLRTDERWKRVKGGGEEPGLCRGTNMWETS